MVQGIYFYSSDHYKQFSILCFQIVTASNVMISFFSFKQDKKSLKYQSYRHNKSKMAVQYSTVAIFLKWQDSSLAIMDYHVLSWTTKDYHGLS